MVTAMPAKETIAEKKITPLKKDSPKTAEIRIEDISNRFDVRKALDDDRVIYLAELYQAGVELPPIRVIELGGQSGKYAYVDGRHRGAARALLSKETVEAIIEPNTMEPFKLFADALHANWGGAKPPSREDITHTITRMFEIGAKERDITKELSFLPLTTLRQYIKNAQGVLHARNIRRALDLVASGASIADAAKAAGLEPEQVRDSISGKKRKWSTGTSAVLADAKRYVTRSLHSANIGIGQKVESLLRQAEHGEVKTTLVIEVIDAWERHLKSTLHRTRDWRERVNHINIS